MPPCLTLRIIRLGSRVKWINLRNGVAFSLTLGVVVIENVAFGSPSTNIANFTTIWHQVFLADTNNFQADLFHCEIGHLLVQPERTWEQCDFSLGGATSLGEEKL